MAENNNTAVARRNCTTEFVEIVMQQPPPSMGDGVINLDRPGHQDPPSSPTTEQGEILLEAAARQPDACECGQVHTTAPGLVHRWLLFCREHRNLRDAITAALGIIGSPPPFTHACLVVGAAAKREACPLPLQQFTQQ